MCKPLVNHVRKVSLEHLRKKKLVVWTLNLVSVRKGRAVRNLGVMKSRISVNRSEVMCQESDASVRNTLAYELEPVDESLLEEDGFENMERPSDEVREQESMEDGEQRDGSVGGTRRSFEAGSGTSFQCG